MCLKDKVKRSIDRIKAFEPPDGYFLGFSGGKDSVVIKALSDMAGVKYDAHYNITTVDPIELVHFIRDKYPDVIWDRPKYSMRQLIIKTMTPPSRHNRYCCAFLKEVNGEGRVVMTGSRWAESLNRYKSQGVVTIFNAKKGSRVADDLGAEYTPLGYYFLQKKVRRHNRQIHKMKILKGNKKRMNQAPYLVHGFRLFDKIKYNEEVGFIFARRQKGYFDIRKLDSSIITYSASYKKLKLLDIRRGILTEKCWMLLQKE